VTAGILCVFVLVCVLCQFLCCVTAGGLCFLGSFIFVWQLGFLFVFLCMLFDCCWVCVCLCVVLQLVIFMCLCLHVCCVTARKLCNSVLYDSWVFVCLSLFLCFLTSSGLCVFVCCVTAGGLCVV
jgi:hypothetical protein